MSSSLDARHPRGRASPPSISGGRASPSTVSRATPQSAGSRASPPTLVGRASPPSAAKPNAVDKLNTFHFEGARKKGGLAYHEQGSDEWDTEEHRAARAALFSSSKLHAAALQFWTTLGKDELDDTIGAEEYGFVHRRITKALAPELSDADAAEAAIEDWQDDAMGAARMTFEQFRVGLVGIADMW